MHLARIVSAGVLALSMILAAPERSEAADNVSIAAASVGGSYFAIASAWSKPVSDKSGIPISVEVTGGGAHNVQLVHGGTTALGVVGQATAYEGIKSEGWAKGKGPFNDLRAMVPLHPNYYQFRALSGSGIKNITDLNGKTVSLAGAGSIADVVGKRLFEFFGIKPAKIVHAGQGESNSMMRDGLVASTFAMGALPHSAVMELASTEKTNVVGLTQEQAERFVKAYPAYSIGSIPAGSYPGQDEPIVTITDWNLIAVNKDVADEVVYKLTKSTFESQSALVSASKALKDTLPKSAKHINLQFHPGAIRYYKEAGIELPATSGTNKN